MDQPNFGSILDRPSGSIEPPKPMPVGEYVFVIQGQPRQDKSERKGTEFVEFTCKPIQALDSVDQDALKEFGGLGEATQRLTFYLTEKSVYRLNQFILDDLQIDNDGGETRLRELISQTPGAQFIGTIKHTPSDDGKAVYANITNTAPVA